MPPFLGGGEMIRDVRLDGFTTNEVPWKFEAGTPPIAEAIGLGAAIDYLESVGMDRITAHEDALTALCVRPLARPLRRRPPDLRPPPRRAAGGAISIGYRDIHPHDLAQVLDQRASAYVPATIAPSPSCAGWASPRPPGRRSTCTTTRRTSTPCSTPSPGGQSSSPKRRSRTAMAGLEDLYREIILDHYRSPRNRGELPVPPAHRVEGFNPLCGDEVVVYLEVDDAP